MIQFNWIILAMKCKVEVEGLSDVVITIHWEYNATKDIDEKTYFAESYGVTPVPMPSRDNFIPYKELTKGQVTGWIEDILNITTMQLALEANIELQINPIDVTLLPPFEN